MSVELERIETALENAGHLGPWYFRFMTENANQVNKKRFVEINLNLTQFSDGHDYFELNLYRLEQIWAVTFKYCEQERDDMRRAFSKRVH